MFVKIDHATETATSQAIIDQVTNSEYQIKTIWDRRLPTIYKLLLAGLSDRAILNIMGGEEHRTFADIEGVRQLMSESPDLDRLRTQIAVELDGLYDGILSELATDPQLSGGVKAKLIEQARETLMDKADLYGLRSATINIAGQAKLMALVAELKTLGEAGTTDERVFHVAEPVTKAIPVETD